ncbi:CotH kinase family protein [Ruminococcus flavefaciens]|uniref:CotH protein n=1 Tax=Ruminococcus flavefaciens TaxID=1265 RepID=A0A1M7LKK4_RUMFL|nr:CotH kinase family protein [Ruminococcus flavefaciens]SHM78667.1 CotH protein [Ruminococcus flavefaciens]
MNKLNKILSVSLSAVLLFGCSAKKDEKIKIPEIQTSSVSENLDLPIISIQTESTAENVMDFVKCPVAKHVAESKASWTPGYVMPPEPYYENCYVKLTTKDGSSDLEPCAAQVKVRGNWTTDYPKKPLRIKFKQKTNLLGLNNGAEFKNWVLLAEYKDGSMLRNKAAFFASRQILSEDGLYSADSQLVNVEVNGEYMGVYLLTEQQQVSENRVNINSPKKDYKGTDIGYFLEFDGYFENEEELKAFPLDLNNNALLKPYDGNDGSGRTIKCLSAGGTIKQPLGVTIKSEIYSQEQHDFIENFVNNTYKIMYEAAYNDKAFVFDDKYKTVSETTSITPQQAVENVVDIQSLVDMYIISELTCDADITWSSFYMDADFSDGGSKKLRFEAPWDFDSSMGNRPRCEDGYGYYAANIIPDPSMEKPSINPWLAVLAYEDWYRDMVKDTWTKAYDKGIFEQTCKMIEEDSEKYQQDFKENYKKWNNLIVNYQFEFELSDEAKKCTNEKQAAEYLTKWLQKRIEFLNSEWHT